VFTPYAFFVDSAPAQVSGLEKRQLDAGPGSWNHHRRKPTADGWLCQYGGGAICSQALSAARRTFFTVASNVSTATGFNSVAAS
jgi:hypothetical protein